MISSISRSSPAEMVLEEVTIGLLLAREGVPREPEARLTSTKLPPKLTRPKVPITCCKGKEHTGYRLLSAKRE